MKTPIKVSLFILLLLLSVVGIFRLKFQTDLTSILPSEVAQVESVKPFHQHFDDDHQVVILLRCPNDKVYPEDIEDLAAYLSKKHPNSEALSESIFESSPALFAQEVARTWATSKPEIVTELSANLQNTPQLRDALHELKNKIKNSFQSGEAIRHSYDPLGFIRHPGLMELAESEYSFESDNGETRFLFLKRKKTLNESYKDDATWVSQVRDSIEEWVTENDGIFTYGITGGPAYNAEIGAGMEKDLLGTVGITIALISILFLLLQREFKQLVLLIFTVSLTFFLTLGIAGWIIPSLNMLSIAFAAILLGLVIDYTVVLLREERHTTKDRKNIRRDMRSSILLAALTTSLVFSVLLMSSFPGVRQLGILIVLGLSCGAAVTLYIVPRYLEKNNRPAPATTRPHKNKLGKYALTFPLILMGASIFLTATKGAPQFEFSLSSLQPKSSESAKVQTEISDTFSSWSELRTVIFAQADSAADLEQKLNRAQKEAKTLVKSGFLQEALLPAQMVPYSGSYEKNIVRLKSIAEKWDTLLQVAQEEGFTTSAMHFDEAVINEIKALPNTYEDFTKISRPEPLTKGMIAENDGKLYFRGNVVLTEPLTPAHLSQVLPLNSNGITMTGWGTLSAVLEPLVRSDFRKIFLPASTIILLSLGLVFRNLKDTLLSSLILLSSLSALNALMSVMGMSWNLLNCIAFPLTIGIGIDYSIHLIFALRKQEKTGGSIWRGVGAAIIFCGFSSVIGFGSLIFTNNELIQSLGIVCALGVLITMVLTLVTIPAFKSRKS